MYNIRSLNARRKKLINFQSRFPGIECNLLRSCSNSKNFINVIQMNSDLKNFKIFFDGPTAPLIIRKKSSDKQITLISEMVHTQLRAWEPATLFYKYNSSQKSFINSYDALRAVVCYGLIKCLVHSPNRSYYSFTMGANMFSWLLQKPASL